MKTRLEFVTRVLAATLFAAPAVAAETSAAAQAKARALLVRAANERLTKTIQELNSRTRRAGTAEIVKAIDDFVAQDADATNAEVRAWADYACFDMCSKRSSKFGRRYGSFDEKTAAETIERVAKRVLSDAGATKARKLEAADYYSALLANAARYAEAEKVVKDVVALEGADANVNASAQILLMKVYRWWGKYAEAVAAGRAACKLAANRVGSVALMMDDFDSYGDAFALWREFSTEANEFYFYMSHEGGPIFRKPEFNASIVKRLRAWIRDEKIPVQERFQRAAGLGLLAPDTPEAAADRALFKGLDLSDAKFRPCRADFVSTSYLYGDWAHFTRLMDELGTIRVPDLKSPPWRCAYAMALAYQGRDKEALASIARDRAAEGLKPADAAKFDALAAVIRGQDALPAIRKLDLPIKELLEVYLLPAQFALNLKRNDECRRYAEAYRRLFKEIPHRRVDVPWFDAPVTAIADWRAIRSRLKPTFVDVKMCGDLDNLETDVATGRNIEAKTALDNDQAKMEVTQLCDVRGLHVFLAVADKGARLVESGFASGLGLEAYFAPGANQPYICFGTNPRTGVDYDFQTAYTTIDHTRLERAKSDLDADALRSEVQFTDDEYVCHLFFPWEAFYQKLPAKPGTAWKLEFLCWGTGTSWGGAQGIHESSSWGDLVFNLTPAQLTAIRRRLVLATYRNWNAAPQGTCAPFDRWADDVIGDPDFYRTCLKPLENELRGYAARVKPDMTDADVNEIFVKGVQRWMGLKYEIDLLRRNYLTACETK